VPSWPPHTDAAAAGPPLRAMVADEHGRGAPVVLLHGQPGDGHDWDDVIERLGGRVRLLVPDRPGYGRTGGPAGTVAGNVGAVCELLDRNGIERAVLVGFSWGGAVALSVAQRHPDRVTALVLVASVGGPGSVDDLDRVLGARLVGPLLALSGLMVLRASRVRRLLASAHSPRDPSAVARLPDRWLSSWRSFVTEQRALLAELPGITAALRFTDVAAVVLLGEADRLVRPRSQAALAAELPRATLVRVAGCGHLLTREVPDVVAEVILDAAGEGRRVGRAPADG